MASSNLYTRVRAAEIVSELRANEKKSRSAVFRKSTLKKIVANMTLGNNEMAGLSSEVLAITLDLANDTEAKRLGYLFFSTYYPQSPHECVNLLPMLENDFQSQSAVVRSLSIRTLATIQIPEFLAKASELVCEAMADKDPHVRKSGVYAVSRIYGRAPEEVREQFLTALNHLLHDPTVSVVAAAVDCLRDLVENYDGLQLSIDRNNCFRIVELLAGCDEWSQVSLLNSVMAFVPQTEGDAISLAEKCIPLLQHGNSSVVLNALKVIVYLSNYVRNFVDVLPAITKRVSGCISNLMSKPAEIQFLTMRNVILLLLDKAEMLDLQVSMFFCQFDDPVYIKDTKLELIFLLANESNISLVLRELEEYALEIDDQMVRKSIRAIGNLAIKIPSVADRSIEVLGGLLASSLPHIVQEVAIILKDILRKYPGKYLYLIDSLVQNVDLLTDSDSRGSFIWILGEYCSSIPDSADILQKLYANFDTEPTQVQLTTLTAVVKAYLCLPSKKTENLVLDVLRKTTEEANEPDVRERAYFYWRLLSSHKDIKDIVKPVLPIIEVSSDKLPPEILEELELNIGSLASIYLRPVQQVFRLSKPRRLPVSPALTRTESRASSAPFSDPVSRNTSATSVYK
ncbi:hypothetical protein KL930_004753 [Ogataea haglerorum]|nr:hypothetical protein KL951_004701 [Ogataea haglerorum]KAG7772970.1 hypothetical protein KL930_004753 [Ogataea haglerorum]KAG7775781.1 hypothetical protein KL922_004141 [Ogataea haglerorum]KAG7797303.1 hypothetical protein KL944_004788 [Ogataea haglerorum]